MAQTRNWLVMLALPLLEDVDVNVHPGSRRSCSAAPAKFTIWSAKRRNVLPKVFPTRRSSGASVACFILRLPDAPKRIFPRRRDDGAGRFRGVVALPA